MAFLSVRNQHSKLALPFSAAAASLSLLDSAPLWSHYKHQKLTLNLSEHYDRFSEGSYRLHRSARWQKINHNLSEAGFYLENSHVRRCKLYTSHILKLFLI